VIILSKSKGEIVEDLRIAGKIKGEIDYAIPAEWSKEVRELGINPEWYVVNYTEEHRQGKLINLAELVIMTN
jgi:hypothetical protein